MIIEEASKLDKLSDCSAEVAQEADNSKCFESTRYASKYTPSGASPVEVQPAMAINNHRDNDDPLIFEEQKCQ